MSRIRIDELEFKCSLSGAAGPLFVLLHGFGGGPIDFHRLTAELGANYRFIIPNLTPLFSSHEPLSFSRQIQIIKRIIHEVNSDRERFFLLGSSYGGTLSWGVRAEMEEQVLGHVLVNPMPIDPIKNLKSAELSQLFGMNMVPGALPLYLKSRMGKEMLSQLGGVFGMGVGGRRDLGGLTERKLSLIAKAVQRFAWIAQHEDWERWREACRHQAMATLILSADEDPLFHERDFRSFQILCGLSEHTQLTQAGHLAIRSHAVQIVSLVQSFVDAILSPKEPDGNLKAVI